MQIGLAQIGIIVTTVITAVIHLFLGQPLFILNGLGYLGLLAAYFLPVPFLQQHHRLIRWVFAAYTLVTIVLYFVFHPGGVWQEDGLGVATKLVEVILLLLLIFDGQTAATEEGLTS